MNKTLTLFTTIAAITFASSAFAAAEAVQDDKDDIQGDINSIGQNDVDLQKHRHELRIDRAAKAADKVNGDTAKQAADSVRIGADLTAIAAKKLERKANREKLDHDEKELHEDSADNS